CDSNDKAMPLSGCPSKRLRKTSDQTTLKPQLAGLSDATVAPFAASISTHAASEPSRGQLAPPSASTVARASTVRSPSAVRNNNRPSSPQPVQRWRSAKRTPAASNRRSQGRSNGDALKVLGKTRPLDPTKVG